VTVGYDHYEFTSNESVLPQIKELSKRFGDVRFAIQSWSEKTSEKDHMTIIEIEKSHMVLHAGEIISESKQTSYESSFRNDVKSIEEPKTQKEKQDLSVQKNTMFELQERFFKDIQDFMKDFTSTFFKRGIKKMAAVSSHFHSEVSETKSVVSVIDRLPLRTLNSSRNAF
jgi:catalase (peroxidase I)